MPNVIRVTNPLDREVRRLGVQLSAARGPFRLRLAEVRGASRRRGAQVTPRGSHLFEIDFGRSPLRPDETLELIAEHRGSLPTVVRRVELVAPEADAKASKWWTDLEAAARELVSAVDDPPTDIQVAKQLFADFDRETHHAGPYAEAWTNLDGAALRAADVNGYQQRFAAVTTLPALLQQSLRARIYRDDSSGPLDAPEDKWGQLRLIGSLHFRLMEKRLGSPEKAVKRIGHAFVCFAARKLVRIANEDGNSDTLYLNGEPDSANFLLFSELFHLLAHDPAPLTPLSFWKALEPYLVAAEAAFGHVYEPRPPYRKDMNGYTYARFHPKRAEELDIDGLIHGMLALDPKQMERRQRDLRRAILFDVYGHLPGVSRRPEDFWEYVIPSLPPRSPSKDGDPAGAGIRKLRLKPVV